MQMHAKAPAMASPHKTLNQILMLAMVICASVLIISAQIPGTIFLLTNLIAIAIFFSSQSRAALFFHAQTKRKATAQNRVCPQAHALLRSNLKQPILYKQLPPNENINVQSHHHSLLQGLSNSVSQTQKLSDLKENSSSEVANSLSNASIGGIRKLNSSQEVPISSSIAPIADMGKQSSHSNDAPDAGDDDLNQKFNEFINSGFARMRNEQIRETMASRRLR